MAKYSDEEQLVAMQELVHAVGIDRHELGDVQRLFVLSVGRIALKTWRRQDAVESEYVIDERDEHLYWINGIGADGTVDLRVKWRSRAQFYVTLNNEKLTHILDWLRVAGRDHHAWLNDRDNLGRPKKLMKMGSIDAAYAEAAKQLDKLLNGLGARASLPETDETVVLELGDYSIVQMLTPAALDAESKAMHHCIGLGSYDANLGLPGVGYFSVRDEKNQPRATLEIVDGVIAQFHGRFDADPPDDVAEFVQAVRWHLGWITHREQQEYLFPDVADAISAVVERGRLTWQEREAALMERALDSVGPGFRP